MPTSLVDTKKLGDQIWDHADLNNEATWDIPAMAAAAGATLDAPDFTAQEFVDHVKDRMRDLRSLRNSNTTLLRDDWVIPFAAGAVICPRLYSPQLLGALRLSRTYEPWPLAVLAQLLEQSIRQSSKKNKNKQIRTIISTIARGMDLEGDTWPDPTKVEDLSNRLYT